MAILRAGVLGGIRGKVAGVVGGQWKDKHYIREYVKPINPNTTAQATQRLKFKQISECLQFIVGPVGQQYMDPMLKSMSAWNWLIKKNMSCAGDPINYTALQVTQGNLWNPISMQNNADSATDQAVITFTTELGNGGLASDKIYAVAIGETTKIWGFAAAEVLRSSGTITVPVQLTSGEACSCYVFASRYVGSQVVAVANSTNARDNSAA